MAANYSYVGGSQSGYLPQATGQIIGFIRNPREFKIQRYIQNVQAPAPVFAYSYIDPDQPVRIFNRAEFLWEDGAERPTGHWNLISWQMAKGETQRLDIPWMLGNQAIETTKKFSGWDPAQVEQAQIASQMMTLRTSDVITVCQTATNWGANTADANVVNGGFGNWVNASSDPTSPFYLAIRKTFTNVMQVINLGTNGVIKYKDMRVVVNPVLATAMANTSEIYDYVKYGPFAEARQRGEDVDMNEEWGLPHRYAGVEIVVEDAPQVTIQPQANVPGTGSFASITLGQRAYVKDSHSAIFMSRPGGINAAYGSKNFSTVQLYFYKWEMAAYEYSDPRNERSEGHITEMRCAILAAPLSGFLVTNCA
jgi:hypothetical protein